MDIGVIDLGDSSNLQTSAPNKIIRLTRRSAASEKKVIAFVSARRESVSLKRYIMSEDLMENYSRWQNALFLSYIWQKVYFLSIILMINTPIIINVISIVSIISIISM